MIINLSFAQLHSPLFLSGKNHHEKLYSSAVGLKYDTKEDVLIVFYKNDIAIVPSSNISSMTPIEKRTFLELFKESDLPSGQTLKTNVSHPMKLDIRGAQVEDPTTIIQNPIMTTKKAS